jgi:hypothetical protein
MRFEEAGRGGAGAIVDEVDIAITGGPEIFEQRPRKLFGERSGGVAQMIKCLAQRAAPLLVPAGLAAVASAVGAPTLDAVLTAP